MKKIMAILISGLLALNAFATLTIENLPATNITTTSAWFRALIASTNADTNTPICTVHYGTVDYSTNWGAWYASNVYGTAGTGIISKQVTGLSALHKYYFRWMATNSTSTVWSSATSNFWTKPLAPTSTPAVVTISVQTDTNGVLKAPTNFFRTNSNLITEVVGNAGYLSSNTGNWAGTWKGLNTNDVLQTSSVSIASIPGLTTGLLSRATTQETDIIRLHVGAVSASVDNVISGLNVVSGRVDGVMGRTSLWNQASIDGVTATSAIPRITTLENGTSLWATVSASMTNFIPVDSPSNYLVYNPATRLLSGCVTNAGAGGVTNHNDLVNIQGGATGNYYHLTLVERAIATNPPSTNGLASTNWVLSIIPVTNGLAHTNWVIAQGYSSGDASTNWSLRAATQTVNFAGNDGTNIRTLNANLLNLTNQNVDVALLTGRNIRLESLYDGPGDITRIRLSLMDGPATTNVCISSQGMSDEGYAWSSYFRYALAVGSGGYIPGVGGDVFRVTGDSRFVGKIDLQANPLTNASLVQASTGAFAVVTVNGIPALTSTVYGVTSGSAYRGDWGAAASNLAAAALPASSTNALAVTALRIAGASPTNGAVWIATNAAGQGKWSLPVGFLYWNAANNQHIGGSLSTPILTTKKYDLRNSFDGTNFVAPVTGLYSFRFGFYDMRQSGPTLTFSAGYIVADATYSAVAQFPAIATAAFGETTLLNHYLTNGAMVHVEINTTTGCTNWLDGGYGTTFSGALIREIP